MGLGYAQQTMGWDLFAFDLPEKTTTSSSQRQLLVKVAGVGAWLSRIMNPGFRLGFWHMLS